MAVAEEYYSGKLPITQGVISREAQRVRGVLLRETP